jgi:hypothetical protein
MTTTNSAEPETRNDIAASLRHAANTCAYWRVCANAKCRRAKCCRGSAFTCGRRNHALIPPLVREYFISMLAAKWAGLPFETFQADMRGSEEAAAYLAWRNAR